MKAIFNNSKNTLLGIPRECTFVTGSMPTPTNFLGGNITMPTYKVNTGTGVYSKTLASGDMPVWSPNEPDGTVNYFMVWAMTAVNSTVGLEIRSGGQLLFTGTVATGSSSDRWVYPTYPSLSDSDTNGVEKINLAAKPGRTFTVRIWSSVGGTCKGLYWQVVPAIFLRNVGPLCNVGFSTANSMIGLPLSNSQIGTGSTFSSNFTVNYALNARHADTTTQTDDTTLAYYQYTGTNSSDLANIPLTYAGPDGVYGGFHANNRISHATYGTTGTLSVAAAGAIPKVWVPSKIWYTPMKLG